VFFIDLLKERFYIGQNRIFDKVRFNGMSTTSYIICISFNVLHQQAASLSLTWKKAQETNLHPLLIMPSL
jgi:hypothetical protein